jgi:hypothetical protein
MAKRWVYIVLALLKRARFIIVRGYRGRVSHEAIIEAIRLVTSQFIKTLPELKTA